MSKETKSNAPFILGLIHKRGRMGHSVICYFTIGYLGEKRVPRSVETRVSRFTTGQPEAFACQQVK